ncbi:MAG: hypothetical protein V1921_00545 [Candidatus Altiarchaeota archaeon]
MKLSRRKQVALMFLFALAVRVFLATLYTPVGGADGNCDQCNYLQHSYSLLEGKPKALVSIILAPVMLLGRLLGLDDLTGTIVGGCLIGALNVIPLWVISEKLKVNPMITTLLYVFSPLDIAEVLTWGGYSLLLGILTVNTFVALETSRRSIITPLILVPVVIAHRTSGMYISLFMLSLLLYSIVRSRRADRFTLSAFAIVTLASLMLYAPYVTNSLRGNSIDLQAGLSAANAKNVPGILYYLVIAGPLTVLLAASGIPAFLKNNNESALLMSWVFLPHILTFIPFFTNQDYNIRLLAFAAGSLCVPISYAFENLGKKSEVVKAALRVLLVLMIVEAVIRSILAFSSYGVR